MPEYLMQVNVTESYLYTVTAKDVVEAKRRAIAAYLEDLDPSMEDGGVSAEMLVETTDGEEEEA